MLILSLLILQLLSPSFCYDIQMEGFLEFGKKVLSVLRSPSKIITYLYDLLPDNIEGKGKLPEILEPVETRAKNDTIINKKTDPLEQFLQHLQRKGRHTLENLGAQIITELNIKWNITPVVETVTNDYVEKMQNYYEFGARSQNSFERDSQYLDMVETSSKLLHHDEKKLLNDIVMHEKHNAHDGPYIGITRRLFKRSKKDKMETLKYVCNTYRVCRQYPAFSDNAADLITEVLRLDDKQFSTVLGTINKILKQNEKILTKISEKEDRELIMAKLRDFSNDISDARESFSLAKAVITERFKTVSSGTEELKIRNKAAKIVLDIIDKALSTEDDILAIDVDNTVQAIRNWSIRRRKEINQNLEDFGNSLLRRLSHQLTKNARQELKVLIQTLMRENTKDNEVYQHLLKYGSKYVKGEDFHSDVDIINI